MLRSKKWVLFSLAVLLGCSCIPERGMDAATELENPGAAAEWRALALQDEHGRVAKGAHQRALQQRNSLILPSSRAPGGEWEELGPTNIAGRTRCLVIDPRNHQRMWLGTAGGGIWRTADGGATWNAPTQQLNSMVVSCMAIDPKNPDVMYAGTGEGFMFRAITPGAGLYKSEDGGDSWRLLDSTATIGAVNRIAISPKDPKILLIATADPGGVLRSTDAGESWQSVIEVGRMGTAVAFSARNPDMAFATAADYVTANLGYEHSILVSDDAGRTWHRSQGNIAELDESGRFDIVPSPKADGLVYLSSPFGLIYKSEDWGATFNLATIAPTGADANFYNHSL